MKRVLMIGGTSHAGKTTLARNIAERLGWFCTSTDKLARHPGRPWSQNGSDVPAHVREHYLILSAADLMASAIAHYQSVWPAIEEIIAQQLAASSVTEGLVIEGSAVLPGYIASLKRPEVSAVWVTASEELFETRIRKESNYAAAPAESRLLIDKFVERTLSFNRWLMANVEQLGLPCIVIDDAGSIDCLIDAVWDALGATTD